MEAASRLVLLPLLMGRLDPLTEFVGVGGWHGCPVAEEIMYCNAKLGFFQTQCMMKCVCPSPKCILAVHSLWLPSKQLLD